MDRHLADAEYERGMRPLTWQEHVRAYCVRFLAWLYRLRDMALVVALLAAMFPATALAEGPHHTPPPWVPAAMNGQLCVAGMCWRWVKIGNTSIGYGPVPGQRPHIMWMQNGRFASQYAPAQGHQYFVNSVTERVQQAGGSWSDAAHLLNK